jgi:hypothetical protein
MIISPLIDIYWQKKNLKLIEDDDSRNDGDESDDDDDDDMNVVE